MELHECDHPPADLPPEEVPPSALSRACTLACALYDSALLRVELDVLLTGGDDDVAGVKVGERRGERHCAAPVIDPVDDDAAFAFDAGPRCSGQLLSEELERHKRE